MHECQRGPMRRRRQSDYGTGDSRAVPILYCGEVITHNTTQHNSEKLKELK